MIKSSHRLGLTALLIFNLIMTGLLYHLYDIVCASLLTHDAKVLIDATYGFFIATLWLLFIVIIFYAKNGHACETQ